MKTIKTILKKIIPPTSGLRCRYGDTLIADKHIGRLLDCLKRCIKLKGNIIEFGVFRGGSLIRMGKLLEEHSSNKAIFGLDTFEGHPYTDNKIQKKGFVSNTNMNKVFDKITENELTNIYILKGKFTDTLPTLKLERFCFAHIDCDLYWSHIEALQFLMPRMVKGGIIYFDDYNTPSCDKVNEAVHKFIKKSDLFIFPDKQAYYVVK